MIDTRLPRFKIASNVFDAMSIEDILDTGKDMAALNLYNPPFEELFIQAKIKFIAILFKKINPDLSFDGFPPKSEIMFEYRASSKGGKVGLWVSSDGNDFNQLTEDYALKNPGMEKWFIHLAKLMGCVLIVLLATKNIQKDVEVCKKPNSRKRREQILSRYSSTTTINIGKITKTMRSGDGNGGPVRPHLRRGHIRNQPYGSGKLDVRQIFIQPVFVNADKGWINTQKEYRVTA